MLDIRRRSYVVNKGLQYRFVFLCIGYVAAFLFILGLALFIPPAIQMETADLNLDEHLRAADRFAYLHMVFWPTALLSLLVIGLHAVYISNRVAGPLYRHMMTFLEVIKGRLPKPIRLRKNDYLKEESEVVNDMLQSLRQRVSELQEEHAQLSYLIYRMSGAVQDPSSTEASDALLTVSEKEKEIVAKLNSFKIE